MRTPVNQQDRSAGIGETLGADRTGETGAYD
jgi:hypothetical protein